MDNLNNLQKEITEIKYLATENTYRYRPIMRFFYHKYEQAQNWLYKEEIYENLKDKILDYTIDDLERDLTTLVENKSLTTVQDVKSAQTLEDFKNKKFRYQMTDYAIEIERLTINLEEMEVKTASLSPRRFENLKNLIMEIKDINNKTLDDFSELWNRIINEFKDLNHNYQDFLKKFQESKTEELLESTYFLEYKNKMISYLQDFIKGYLNNGNKIKNIIKELDANIEEQIVNKLEQKQRELPKISQDFNYKKFNELNRGKWQSIVNWFVGNNGISEGDRLLEVTNSIITQISKCVSSLIELHGNMSARKEEYKNICKLFDSKNNIKECHKLSSVIFGINEVRHFKGISNLDTDLIVPSYDVNPILIEVEPHEKQNRAIKNRVIIESKSDKKKEIIIKEKERLLKEKEILLKFVNQKTVNLIGKVNLNKSELNYILNLISRSNKRINKESILGLTYIIEPSKEKCQIITEDGTLYMDGIKIIFNGGNNNE